MFRLLYYSQDCHNYPHVFSSHIPMSQSVVKQRILSTHQVWLLKQIQKMVLTTQLVGEEVVPGYVSLNRT